MLNDRLAQDLYTEISRIPIIDSHSHINPHRPTARHLFDEEDLVAGALDFGHACAGRNHGWRVEMLYTLAVILLIAWLLGIVGTYTIGAFVHVLLVIAMCIFAVKICLQALRQANPTAHEIPPLARAEGSPA